ncbi:MAG: SDR family oxidoreductase [Saprospiraceae bacterium]|nr:SDR family oxidoreductase [Saprospiraceae bacterium]
MNERTRYAVVTGGTKGIGRAICQKLASEGMHVAVCARNQADLATLESELAELEISVLTRVADVSRKQEVLDFVKEITDRWPRIDLLVNNAGVFIPGAILEEEEGRLEQMIETNLYSAYHLTRALMPALLKSPMAHIFNICSIASQIAYPNGGSYTISKFALLGLTKALRAELLDKNVRVTAVLPGATWSHSWKGVDLPEDRLMKAQDVADVVLATYNLSPSAVVEEIILRPQLGDL